MTAEEPRSDPVHGQNQPRTSNILIVATDLSGLIVLVANHWPGVGIPQLSAVADLAHSRNHDLVDAMLEYAADSGLIDQGVGVCVARPGSANRCRGRQRPRHRHHRRCGVFGVCSCGAAHVGNRPLRGRRFWSLRISRRSGWQGHVPACCRGRCGCRRVDAVGR